MIDRLFGFTLNIKVFDIGNDIHTNIFGYGLYYMIKIIKYVKGTPVRNYECSELKI